MAVLAVLSPSHLDTVGAPTTATNSESKELNTTNASEQWVENSDYDTEVLQPTTAVARPRMMVAAAAAAVSRVGCWHVMQWSLFTFNLLTWYWSNGMNGIAMQSFASKIRQQHQQQQPSMAFYVATTSFVTALQLLLGALVGTGLLFMLFHAVTPLRRQQQQRRRSFQIVSLLSFLSSPKNQGSKRRNQNHSEWFLSGLHGLGSLTTNLGFMYGTAYLVQIIKLLEPLETLLFSFWFASTPPSPHPSSALMVTTTSNAGPAHKATSTTSTSSTVCRVGIVCSILVVIGSAISLIQHQQQSAKSNHNQLIAIVFALLSGCTLSLRNVCQQKQHALQVSSAASSDQQQIQHHAEEGAAGTTAGAAEPMISKIIEQEDISNPSPEHIQLSKLERSVMQFTKLSFQSGLVMAAISLLSSIFVALPTNATIMLYHWSSNSQEDSVTSNDITTTAIHTWLLFETLTWNVLLWHPLYNVTSMIVLGFCGSAVTHSLFNAGKRVFSILIALLWMEQQQKQLTSLKTTQHHTATYFRLFMVAVGAIWYSLETQQQESRPTNSNNNTGQRRPGSYRQLLASSSSMSLPTTTANFMNASSVTGNQAGSPWSSQFSYLFKILACVVMVVAVLFP